MSGPSLQVAPDRAGRSEERRVVSVLFADLIGSTALAERLDPEDMRALLSEMFEALAREVLRLDGTVDKYVGDEIMAVFGAPIAHEDDAIRAVTAAAAMQHAMKRLNDQLEKRHGHRLALRVGINTGEVVSGVLSGPVQAAYTVVGDAVNTARRLQAAARPGEIVVGERTRQAAARMFDFGQAVPIVAKGKADPVQTYAYLRVKSKADRSDATEQTAFVGRAREREALIGAVDRLREGKGGIVAVLGEPGLGKTRLVAEARAAARAAGLVWLEGHASSHGAALSYLPFQEILRTFAAIDDADADSLKWTKLEERITQLLPDRAEEILPYLGAALALRMPETHGARVAGLDGDAMRRQVLRGVYILFEGIARASPTAIVLEDWHWVDRSSEQLLAHLLPLSKQLLFIWTGRPEGESAVERGSSLCRGEASGRYQELWLAPLPAEAGVQLLCDLLKTRDLPPGLGEAVLRRSEGNPFFAQELVRAYLDLKVLTRDDDRGDWVLTPRSDAALPSSVQGVIAARIDRLPDGAREVARVASVIGRTFTASMLNAVDGGMPDRDRGIAELIHQAIIQARPGSTGEYSFQHALVQETVYAGILVRTRRELHARVGAAIESLMGARLEELYGVLAYHYARAEVWDKAQDYLQKAGDQALRIAADAEAVGHYERALEAYGKAGAHQDPVARANIERKIGEARYRLGDFDGASRHLDTALELLGYPRPRTRTGIRLSILRELGRQVAHRTLPRIALRPSAPGAVTEAVLQTLWVHQFIDYSADLERLLYDILRTLNLAERSGPSQRTLRAYFGMTLMCHNVGLRGMGTRYARMSESTALLVGGPLAEGLAHASLGMDHYALGRWDRAIAEFTAAATDYRTAGELEAWAGISAYLNQLLVAQGKLSAAYPIASELERTGRESRDRRIEALGPHCRGHVLSWAGRTEEAAGEYARAMTSYRTIPDHHLWLSAAGAVAMMHLRNDSTEAARQLIEDGLRIARERRLRGWWLTPLLTAQADLLLRDAAVHRASRSGLLDEAERVCSRLMGQTRLHDEALSAAYRHQGALEWQRGRSDRAQAAWRKSFDAAERLGSLTDRFETHETVARHSASAADRDAATSIATHLRSALDPVA